MLPRLPGRMRASSSAGAPVATTPMMQQYLSIKRDPQYAGAVVLFQLGNFLECFYEDAAICSRVLGIALTTRGNNAGADGAPVPMAGVPLHARDSYISKLVKAGHRVVVVEQQEGSSSSNAPGDAPDPNTATGSRFKRRSTGLARMGTTTGLTASNSGGDSAATSASNATGGGLMRRRVVEIVTRGTATDDSLLTPRSRNLIAAISFLPAADAADGSGGVEAGIAWVDVSTGDFFTARCPVISISAELAVNPPVELLVPSFLKTATTLNSAGSSASNSSAATGTEAIGIEQLQQRLHSSKTGRNASANASRPQDPLLQRIGEAISASSSIPLGSSSSSSPSSAMVIDLPGSSGSEVEPLSLTVLHGSLFSAALGRALIDQAAAASTATATAASAGSSQQPSLSSSSSLSAPELSAASGLLSYVSWTQQGRMPVLRPPTSLSSSPSSAQQQQSQAPMQAAAAMAGTSDQSPQVPLLTRLLASSSSSAPQRMVIDPSTRRSLEITRPINGRRRARGSLLHTLDLCVTAVGSRLLDQRLCSPLLHAPLLNHRLDAVQALYTNDNLREALRKCLNAVPDIERSLHRVAMRRGGAPALLRDLLLVRDGLAAAVRVGAMMASGDHVSFCIDGKASSASSLAGLNKRATGSEVTTEGETIAEEGPDKGATEASGSIAAPASENSATPASSSAVTTSSSGSNRKAGYIIGATNFNASLGFGFTTPGFAFGAANGVGDILGPLSAPASAADRSDAFGKNKPPVSDGTTAAATKELKPLRSAYERAVDNAIAPLLADVNEWASDKPRASTCVAPAAVSSLVELGCRHDFDVTVTNGSAAGIKISSRKGVGDSAVLALASACALLPYASTDASIAAVYRDLIAALDPPLPSALVSLHGVGPGTSSFGDAPEAVGVSVPSNGTSNNSNNNASGIRIRAGYSADLDAARALRDSAHTALAALQDKLRAATGIKNLKVRLTEEQGCVAEVPTAAADGLERAQMQQPEQTGTGGGGKDDNRGSFFPFRRLKTLKATVRYTCPALHQLDRDIREASYRADYQENAILAALCTKVTAAAQEIASVARAVAVIDVSAGLAEAAKRYSLKRPEFVASDDTAAASTSSLELRSLRHLVVERSLMESWVHRATGMAHQMQLQASGATSQAAADEGKAATTDSSDETETQATAPLDADGFESRDLPDDPAPPAAFVPNDCLLGLQPPSPSKSTGSKALSGDAFSEALQASAHVSILTGSNMAGKSTWLRSVAHAVILAQMGAYVPADVARFSLVDKLFARVGASDDVSRGRSTFLVEAEETANILTSATSSSLCLVDEIGRGTSSVDGLAIAYSVLEHLMHSIRCRTLFATHIHELAGMALIAEAKRLGKGCGAKVGIGIDGDYSRPFIQCRGMEAVDDVLLHRELEEQQQEDNQGFSGPSIPHLTHRLAPHPLVGFIREQLASGAPMPAIEDAVWKKASSLSSYGVAVAARAGMPAPVLRRASQISKCLEESAATQAWGKQLSKLL